MEVRKIKELFEVYLNGRVNLIEKLLYNFIV